MLVLDAVLMAAITAAIVGWMSWAIFTQHRDPGCAHLRIRRLRVNPRLATLDESQTLPGSRLAS